MKLGVLSDSHRNLVAVERALKFFKDQAVDLVVHCGDGAGDGRKLASQMGLDYHAVRGNMDPGHESKELILKAGGHKLLVSHGHLHQVNNGRYQLYLRALEKGCQVALYGHTHMAKHEEKDGVHLINPGSCGDPRGSVASLLILTLTEGGVFPEFHYKQDMDLALGEYVD